MADFDVWDVIRVPFPYTARPILQRRPALVVSVGPGLRSSGLLWVLMITSAENRLWPGDVEISDLAEAGLPVPSLVRSAKIATIETAEAGRLGTLSRCDQKQVGRHLGEALREALRAGTPGRSTSLR